MGGKNFCTSSIGLHLFNLDFDFGESSLSSKIAWDSIKEKNDAILSNLSLANQMNHLIGVDITFIIGDSMD